LRESLAPASGWHEEGLTCFMIQDSMAQAINHIDHIRFLDELEMPFLPTKTGFRCQFLVDNRFPVL
jgi:hypothetical protein